VNASEIRQNIQLIYERYSIPKNLQRHMMQVAAVGEQLSNASKMPVNKNNIVAALLIHDLGNLVKMQLHSDEKIKLLDLEDQNKVEYYRKKQKEFIEKYSSDDFVTNKLIAKEIGVENEIIDLLPGENPLQMLTKREVTPKNIEKIICIYSDLRVSPTGVTTIKERLAEYAKRHSFDSDPAKTEHSNNFVKAAEEMERKLFLKMNITPKEITKDSVKKLVSSYL
jgi:hypothetical protein